MKIKITICIAVFFLITSAKAQTTKILFDATKAETAGNADWVIDADVHNLGFNNGPAVVSTGSESNPGRYPTPAQSGVTATTAETFWEGGISYLGIDCVKHGYEVETLPYNGQITYGNASNVQDLSNYKVFVVCEPNILFTASEKTAIINFVQNGGGLFMISDHTNSDRNNDGHDSPQIWNNLIDTNSVIANPFGIRFDYVDISQTSTNVSTINSPIINGTFGNVTEVKWSNGTTMTLSTSANNTAKGFVWKSGSTQNNLNVMMATSKYGNGRVAAIGDSSPFDDSSGDPGDQLYDGYITDAAGNHQKLIMNTMIWLATSTTGISTNEENNLSITIFPQPANDLIKVDVHSSVQENNIEWLLIDINGKIIWQKSALENDINFQISTSNFSTGIYSLVRKSEHGINVKHVMVVH